MPITVTKPEETAEQPAAVPANGLPNNDGAQPNTPPAEEAGSPTTIDWGAMNDEFDHEDSGIEEEAEVSAEALDEEEPGTPPASDEAAQREEPATPKEEQAAEAPAAEEAPTTPETPEVPEVPVAETPTPETEPEAQPAQPTPEQQAADLSQIREEQRAKFREAYQLTEDQASDIIAKPGEVVPEMLANLHMNVLENTITALAGMIPNMVSQVLRQERAAESANTAFFKTWPALNKQEYYKPLQRMIQTYRTNNPNVAQDQLIQEVGAAAHIAFRIDPNAGSQPTGQAPATPPAAPSAQGTGAPPANFRPAAPGGSVPPAPAREKTVWDDLNEQFDAEDG